MSRKQIVPHAVPGMAARGRQRRISPDGFTVGGRYFLATVALWILSTGSTFAAPLNILYFGNSFMEGPNSPYTVPNLVASIATAAGHDTPHSGPVISDGAGLNDHLPFISAVLDYYTPVGGPWDFVVMQDYSTRPTHIGDVAGHRADAVALYQAVDAEHPGVVPVLFETWARGPLNELYDAPSSFPGGATQMQQELRDAYALAAADINSAAGSPIARIANVGDIFEQNAFNAALYYDGEQYHASMLGTLAAALELYSTIYGDPNIGQIDLSDLLSDIGLTQGELDSITQNWPAVPEPSTWALLVSATIGLGMFRFRRLKSHCAK